MLMPYLMSYVLYLIHLMYFSLMLGRVMLTCDSFALVGWTSTPKGGLLQICYKARRNTVEGAYKTCRSQNIT